MKQTLKTITLLALLSGLTTASQAQSVVWSQNFNSLALGPYGAHTTDLIIPTPPHSPQTASSLLDRGIR